MAKYSGKAGFATQKETSPGIWENDIVEYSMKGDVLLKRSTTQSDNKVNDDISITNRFSLLFNPFAKANFSTMKYLTYMGVKWKVTEVEVKYPRLEVTTGGRWLNDQE